MLLTMFRACHKDSGDKTGVKQVSSIKFSNWMNEKGGRLTSRVTKSLHTSLILFHQTQGIDVFSMLG